MHLWIQAGIAIYVPHLYEFEEEFKAVLDSEYAWLMNYIWLNYDFQYY